MKIFIALLLTSTNVLALDFTFGIVNPFTSLRPSETLSSRSSTNLLGRAKADEELVENYVPSSYGPPLPGPASYSQHPYGAPHSPPPHQLSYGSEYQREVILKRVFNDARPLTTLSPLQEDEDLAWTGVFPNACADADTDPNLFFNNAYLKQEKDRVRAITIPHRVTNIQSGIVKSPLGTFFRGIKDEYEVSLSTKMVDINYGDRIVAKVKFSGQTVGTENHPFPKSLVTDDQDDLRLANVGVDLLSFFPIDVYAGLYLTNTGIWAIYQVGVNPKDLSVQSFLQARRVASRASKKEVHNLAIEYDEVYNKFTFLIEDHVVWSAENVGLPSYDPYAVTIIRTNGTRTEVVKPTSMQLNLGSFSYLIATDPNNKYSNTALVLLSKEYPLSNDVKVYDEQSFLMNRVWGQGTVFDLYEIDFSKISSRKSHGYQQSSYKQPGPYARYNTIKKEAWE